MSLNLKFTNDSSNKGAFIRPSSRSNSRVYFYSLFITISLKKGTINQFTGFCFICNSYWYLLARAGAILEAWSRCLANPSTGLRTLEVVRSILVKRVNRDWGRLIFRRKCSPGISVSADTCTAVSGKERLSPVSGPWWRQPPPRCRLRGDLRGRGRAVCD